VRRRRARIRALYELVSARVRVPIEVTEVCESWGERGGGGVRARPRFVVDARRSSLRRSPAAHLRVLLAAGARAGGF
jgi:hypothetical protein